MAADRHARPHLIRAPCHDFFPLVGSEDLGAHLARFGDAGEIRATRTDAGASCVPASRAQLLAKVAAAGLVGRGGAAFPTARKLEAVHDALLRTRRSPIVVVNLMEGEPTSVKDRVLALRAPHLVIDGAIAAAQALGATEVVLCVARTEETIRRAAERPGESVTSSPMGALDMPAATTEAAAQSLSRAIDERRSADEATGIAVTMARPPDRYVSGEATALVRWLGGGPAMPEFRRLRVAESGVDGAPTLLDNAETFAHLALIARFGPEWFRAVGTADDPGSALVTVSGSVADAGVAEIPLGATVAQALDAAGAPSEPLQAVLLGGYGGRWLPFAAAATTALGHHGGRGDLGPGILVALPARCCGLAETARIARYMAGEGAGQCGPCAFGLPALAQALEQLAWPKSPESAQQAAGQVARWANQIAGRGACGHPDGVVRLVRSAMTTFGEDVDRHRIGQACRHVGRAAILPVSERAGGHGPRLPVARERGGTR